MDRSKLRQSQQVLRRCHETAHDANAIASGSMGVLKQLGVTDSVLALNAPSISHRLQQCFSACAESGEKEVFGIRWLANSGSCGADLNDQFMKSQASRMCSGASFAFCDKMAPSHGLSQEYVPGWKADGLVGLLLN
jgi:hypothetical protein